eukprot:358543-Chlamydomonas_euryale.AAC.4
MAKVSAGWEGVSSRMVHWGLAVRVRVRVTGRDRVTGSGPTEGMSVLSMWGVGTWTHPLGACVAMQVPRSQTMMMV